MVAGVEVAGVTAVCMIGYHGRAQGPGVLAHTINSFAFARVFFNEQELGEMGIYGALAGEYGVPVAMASGDDVFVAEHRALFPDTVFVQTKRAHGFSSGVSLSPSAACAAIREGVKNALSRPVASKPLVISGTVTVRLQTQSTALADLFCQWPTLRRLAGDELAFEAPTVEAAVRMLNSLSAMSAMLR